MPQAVQYTGKESTHAGPLASMELMKRVVINGENIQIISV